MRREGALATLPTLDELATQFGTYTLDGADGANRAPLNECQINAPHDYAAIQCWLNEYRHKATTYRHYQREAERLLLWCLFQHRKPFSSLTREDFEAYFHFIENPQPASRWCSAKKGGKGIKRGHPAWRPFVTGLSASSKNTAITILKSLLTYLELAGYLKFNPLRLMRRRHHTTPVAPADPRGLVRVLADNEWQALLSTVRQLPDTTSLARDNKQRTRFLFSITYLLGLRIDDVVTHQWQDFIKVDHKWWFKAIGKGDKEAWIPVNQQLLQEIVAFRTYFKRPPYPAPDDARPLIPSWRSPQGLGQRQLYNIIKQVVLLTAAQFSADQETYHKLRRFSPHWLRHQAGSMLDKLNVKDTHIKAFLRHANMETTRRYIASVFEERHTEIEKLVLWEIDQ